MGNGVFDLIGCFMFFQVLLPVLFLLSPHNHKSLINGVAFSAWIYSI